MNNDNSSSGVMPASAELVPAVAGDDLAFIASRLVEQARQEGIALTGAEALANLVESDEVTLDRATPEVTAAYKELLAAIIDRGKAEEHVTDAVAKLRRAGGSWNLIGPALGVSRQPVRERYALVDEQD